MNKSMSKNKGFSLAEIMIALVIIAILMAASAPLLNKKVNVDNNFSCLWKDKGNPNGQIFYNNNGNGSIGIGTSENLENSIITLKSTIDNKNKITFISNSNASYSMGISNSSLYLGVANMGNTTNSVVIGGTPSSTYPIIDGTFLVSALNSTQSPLIYGNFNTPSLTLNGDVIINTASEYKFTINSPSTFNSISQFGSTLKFGNTTHSITSTGAANFASVVCTNTTTDNLDAKSVMYKGEELSIYISNLLAEKLNSQPSDKDLKNIIGDTSYGLDELRKIEIKEYKFKDEKKYGEGIRYGVIAQEIQKILPNVVKKSKNGYLAINTNDIFFISLNAIKQLDKEVQEIKVTLNNINNKSNYKKENEYLRKENAKLTEQIESLNQRMSELEKKVTTIESKDKSR